MTDILTLAPLDGLAPGARVVVAMSGGVDSSVTAALLAEAGYDVVGVTLKLYDDAEAVMRTGTCCAGRDIRDAEKVAEKLGIDHHVVDLIDTFRRDVIEAFAETYVAGETPIPCVSCNQTVKFRDLLGFARDLGAEGLVTGHYVRREGVGADAKMLAGADQTRDQSYFLFATTPEELDFLHFPLGGMDKDATRAEARRLGLEVAAKPDSQDICFVPDGNYARVVKRFNKSAFLPGDIVDEDGTVLGAHKGYANYTVGQRRGIGIGGGDPLYVLGVDADKNRVIVGPQDHLLKTEVSLRDVNWLGEGDGPPEGGVDVMVKLRSAQPPVAATVFGDGRGGARVALVEPFAGVAPGQACVFYDGTRLLGGGWIQREG